MDDIALITGASRGIGAATAKLFASKGYAVCINYLTNHQAALKLQQQISAGGAKCIAVQADVSIQSEVERLFKACDQQLGTLSVLVNNVGILHRQCGVMDISVERFTETFNSNVISCFLCTQQAIKRMATKFGGVGGSIVNVSSGAAKTGSPNEYVDYAATKGAMDSLTRGVALEVANQGIRVNGVRPGLIYTEMHSCGGEPERVDRLKTRIPIQRGGEVDEVAQSIYWLASSKASFVTGTFIDVTGGL